MDGLMRVFKHGGATGDIVYSLPVVRDLGGGEYWITMQHEQRAQSIKKLLEVQPYISAVHIGNPVSYTNDLDKFRDVFHGAHDSIIQAHYRSQGIEAREYKSGWLTLPGDFNLFPGKSYSVINRTDRYNDPNFDWTGEINYLRTISDEIYFIGYYSEWDIFRRRFGEVNFCEVDFLEGAYLLKHAQMYSGGYSAWSTIAQGLGIAYRLEQAPAHTCSTLFVERETIINV